MNKQELLSCPFCGYLASIEQRNTSFYEGGCGNPDIECCGQDAIYEQNYKTAVARWNNRPTKHFEFGAGKITIATGTYYDKKAIFIEPSNKNGAVGSYVPKTEYCENTLEPDSVVLFFDNNCTGIDVLSDAIQALSDSKDGWREKPTEAMCDNARGFILGLEMRRNWITMQNHLEAGGYNTLPYIQEKAKQDPYGHITKWDIADCIYQLMNQPPKERG